MKALAICALILLPACYTRSVDDEPEAEPTGAEIAQEEASAGLPPSADPLPAGPCDIPLTVSPEGLLVPGAVEVLQRALVEGGHLSPPFAQGELDAPTLEGIVSLQRREDLPATALPDRATLGALGLDPDALLIGRDPDRCEGHR